MHRILTIDASPKQLSKLRNGHAVRIKKGTGFNLIVHPETYNLVSRAFAKSKGMEIALSPEELEMNRARNMFLLLILIICKLQIGITQGMHFEIKETIFGRQEPFKLCFKAPKNTKITLK